MLHFNDGISINTQGEYRELHLSDGWYVVGHGMLIPVDSRDEAIATAEQMRREELEKKTNEPK